MKVRDLTGPGLSAWQEDYPHRQQTRLELGEKAIAAFRRVRQLPQITEHLRMPAGIFVEEDLRRMGAASPLLEEYGLGDILIDEFRWAAAANLGPNGENLDVEVKIFDPAEVKTTEEVNEWGNAYRIHPLLREEYLSEMASGSRFMFVATDYDGEPTGRAFIVVGGPKSNLKDGQQDDPAHEGLPSEDQVKAIIGQNAAWGEDLAVLEGYRGGGVGTRLGIERERYIKANPDLPNIFALAVQPTNEVSLRLQKRLGFMQVPVKGHKTFISHIEGPGRPVILMVKEL